MGWKGTVRSIGAAVRAAERDAKRRQRELERQQKEYDKMQELERAAYEVDKFNNHIEVIQSVHKEYSSPIDWEKLLHSNEPKKPINLKKNERKAKVDEGAYRPGLFDKLLKKEQSKRNELKDAIQWANEKDNAEYQAIILAWKKEVSDWKQKVEVAKLLLQGDRKTKIKIIESINPFAEISNLGSNLEVSVRGNGLVEATIQVHGKAIIPNDTKSLLKSGKLSVKKMPVGKFNEIYQDYVCSCVLRTANELFSIVPDEMVIVTAVDELLSTKTGHLEESAIISACISRSTLKSLNIDAIDPSDSMSNFIHNMSFKKTKGFEAVNRVEPGIK